MSGALAGFASVEKWDRHLFYADQIYTPGVESLTWGTNNHYRKEIPDETLREVNKFIREVKIPGNHWRVNDPGHFHIKK